jgi:FtsP/CotA-like multicopper oxidase with cupredoxin domain
MPRLCLLIIAVLACYPARATAQNAAPDLCPRPAAGSAVPEPPDLRSENGVLEVELAYRNFTGADGETRYCYVSKDGGQAPTLRLKPGDTLVLRLKNELTTSRSKSVATGKSAAPMDMGAGGDSMSMAVADPCASAKMTSDSTNIHFHGLTVPAVCHQDDVLNTMIQPGDPPF